MNNPKLSLADFIRIDLVILKEYGLINDYKVETHQENVTIGKDGVQEYDLMMKITVTPKQATQLIEVRHSFNTEDKG